MKVNDINVSKFMYVFILFNNVIYNEWLGIYMINI